MVRDVTSYTHNATAEKIVKILCNKTQNSDPLFFRVLTSYQLTKLASMMRISIDTHERGNIPINMYAINLGSSGLGKGHSMSILEEQLLKGFRDKFIGETFPEVSEINLNKIINQRAVKKGTNPDDEEVKVRKEFEQTGAILFNFDSGTTAAIKQMRHKLLMADAGAMSLEIDEIGSQLLSNVEVLNAYLELFDVGRIKQKLVKNTSENIRSEDIEGRTPTNMLLFGTPSKLLNGGKTEDELMSFLEAGYGRRCFFGYSKPSSKNLKLTPKEVYDMMTDTNLSADIISLAQQFRDLADPQHFQKTLKLTRAVTEMYLGYKIECEQYASSLPEHKEIEKAEVSHRYFKSLKLAGAYAFIDGADYITEDHLKSAIKLAEESGKAFNVILNRDRNYVKLAKYIAQADTDLSPVDLVEELPFYKGSASQKDELMRLAIAWGYKHHIIIKKLYSDGIEFYRGEALKETDLDNIILSYSDDIVKNYCNTTPPFKKISKLLQLENKHWVNHHLKDGYRDDEHIVPGFNTVVFDIDSGNVPPEAAHKLLEDYVHYIYTTKRHTENEPRYRIVMPISHEIQLNRVEFREMMQSLYEWLPLDADTQTGQRSRKWLTHKGTEFYNGEGEILNIFKFIPKTSKNEEYKKSLLDTQSLTNLERWFVNHTGQGNRNGQLLKYAMLLVDSGADFATVQTKVTELNNKLDTPLEADEINKTIMQTVSKSYTAKR